MADDEITTARRALGRHLAQLRKGANLTQQGLARLVQYGRSSVANTETGRQHPEREFWARCDTALHTGGVLAQEYDRTAKRAQRKQPQSTAVLSKTPDRPQPTGGTGSTEGGEDVSALWETEECINARRLALKSGTDDDARLSYLEGEVHRAIADNERLPSAVLLARMRPLRAYVDQLMNRRQHPRQRARLYTLAAHLSGLLGAVALDLGAFRVAHAYAAEAFDLADTAQQHDVRAWARATQSLIAYYTGDHHDALAYAQDGLRHSGSGPHTIRLTINGKARALAHLGDRYGVDEAVNHSFIMLAEQPHGTTVSTSLALGPYCHPRTAANAATAYLVLNCGKNVTAHLSGAIDAFDAAELRGPQALSRLDLATAYLHHADPDPEQAAELALNALALTADHRYESVNQRTHQFLTSAKPFAAIPQIRHIAEQLATRAHRSRRAPPALPFAT
ncbi:helix-turn-helix transcriptional regulator [Micromonospora arborensis]|uniref:helix-turn-helix domain-containing protein n=1 Tax=Micromonospora sp. NPDC048839 TaxID=3155641 RepID=UPI0033D379FE